MPSKSVLAEYEDACRLIEETESDLIRLRRRLDGVAVDTVRGSNPEFPYEPRSFRIEGIGYGEYKAPEEIREIEKILNARREIAKKKRLEVEYWMNTVPSRIARIVRLRYFKKETWSDIALHMGANSPDTIRSELNRYLKEIANNDPQ